jgi:hypothetical protein
LALVQKGPLFNYLTAVSVMLERSEASQGWGILMLTPFCTPVTFYNLKSPYFLI